MAHNKPAQEQQGWGLLWRFLRDKPLIDVVVTSGYFFVHPLRFTDEVLREDWSHKAKPPRFLIETFVLALLLLLLTPYRDALTFDPAYTETQRHFALSSQLAGFVCAFFGASSLAHFILGGDRVTWVRGFFLFCYIQGANVFAAHVLVASIFLALGKEAQRQTLVVAFIFIVLLGLASFTYTVVPVARAYRPRWYRLLLAALVALLALWTIQFGFAWISSAIIARFPTD